jgi:pentatricopeptide repeat protein
VGEYDKAVDLYKSMREKKIRPDSVTYTVLISGCCKMSKFGEALSFLEEMMHLKLPMSKEVYSSVISAYSKQASI